jgi:prevent-host-death family protein
MSQVWQLQEAKNKFSEVVEKAQNDGPQVVTKRGVESVIILSVEDYRQMIAGQQKISEFFRESPLVGVELDLTRDKTPVRDDFTL